MRKFVKATCTTLAMVGLCAGSAFAATQQFNGDSIIEVGGIAIGPDGSAACNLNEILFTEVGKINFTGLGDNLIDFNSYGRIAFGPSTARSKITGYPDGELFVQAGKSANLYVVDGHKSGHFFATETNTSSFNSDLLTSGERYLSGLLTSQYDHEDEALGYNACLTSSHGMTFVGHTDVEQNENGTFGALDQFGIEIDDDGFIWSWVGPYEYDNGTPNWDDPSSIDPTKLHCRFTIENVSAGTSGFEGAIPDGYAAGSAGRSVMMFSWKEPLFSYDSVEEDVVMDFQDPSAELWLYEEKEGEDDDVDARLIAYEGAARVMTKTASTGAVKAELRAESDGDVVIRLGSN